MTNKKYEQGRRFEYRVKNYLIKKGYFVVRSAGSKGAADLIAILPYCNHSKVFLIQCKYGKGQIDRQEIINLTRLADKYNAIPVLVGIDKDHNLIITDLITKLKIDL
jgi:Holliday junction resolvase